MTTRGGIVLGLDLRGEDRKRYEEVSSRRLKIGIVKNLRVQLAANPLPEQRNDAYAAHCKEQRETARERRLQVEELSLREDLSIEAIAAKIGCNAALVANDLVELRKKPTFRDARNRAKKKKLEKILSERRAKQKIVVKKIILQGFLTIREIKEKAEINYRAVNLAVIDLRENDADVRKIYRDRGKNARRRRAKQSDESGKNDFES